MGLALENNQQRLLSLGMGALAAVCTAYGINDLQRFEPDLDAAVAQAYQAGDDNKQTVLTESRKAKMDGMGALVLGAALGITGWLTSSHEKNDVSPTESARVQPQSVELDLPSIPKQQLRADLVGQLENAISNDKDHVQILKAETIIISGVTGCGKSSVANAIATERKLLLDHDVIVLDPDLQYNLDRWAVGEGYGQPERIAQFLELITTGKGQGKPITFICDEWSKWGQAGEGMEVLKRLSEILPTLAKQALRKRGVHVILITHGLSKDDVCPFSPDGTYTQLMKEAMVIEPLGRQNTKLTAKYATTPTGFGMVSFKGQAPTKRKKIAFCPLWLPGVVQQHLGMYLEHLKMAFDANPIGIKLDPEVTDLIARKMSALEENRDKFERLMHGFDATEHPVEKPESIEWPGGAVLLLRYLFGTGEKWANADEFFPVSKLQQNWGKDNGFNASSFRALLTEMTEKNLGHFRDESNREWKPSISPGILPPDEEIS